MLKGTCIHCGNPLECTTERANLEPVIHEVGRFFYSIAKVRCEQDNYEWLDDRFLLGEEAVLPDEVWHDLINLFNFNLGRKLRLHIKLDGTTNMWINGDETTPERQGQP